MTANTRKNFNSAMKILDRTGLLLLRGYEIRDVCRVVTQNKITGSWWSDPSAQEIFAVSEMISEHPDVTTTKLISGKVTFVHRRLWPKLIAVGNARDDWQIGKLTHPAKLLLRRLDKEGSMFSHELGSTFGKKPSEVVHELEVNLLLHAEQFHTETGFHTKHLETWDHWSKRASLRTKTIDSLRARNFFEKLLEEINEQYSGVGPLPWQKRR